MKTILIPTNFTDVSRHATDYAIRLYGSELERIILLNAFEQPKTGRTIQFSLVDILRRNSELGLEEDRLRIQEEFPEFQGRVDTQAAQGDLSASIRSVLNTENVDLIVMGSKGDQEFVDLFIESRTARVIKNIDHPMLVVPPIAQIEKLHTVIFTSDLKPISGPEVLKELIELCKVAEAGVKGLHITKDDGISAEPITRSLAPFFDGLSFDFQVRKNKDIPTGIYKYIHETEAEIVCLVKRKGAGSLVARLFHTNISHRIVKHVKQTLLLLTDSDFPSASS